MSFFLRILILFFITLKKRMIMVSYLGKFFFVFVCFLSHFPLFSLLQPPLDLLYYSINFFFFLFIFFLFVLFYFQSRFFLFCLLTLLQIPPPRPCWLFTFFYITFYFCFMEIVPLMSKIIMNFCGGFCSL